MKLIRIMMGVAAATMLMVAGSTTAEAQKILVVYYSQTSTTKAVAEEIATRLHADIEEIVPMTPYNGDYNATIERSKKEREMGVVPEVKPMKSNIAKYDVIFLGYPIWFGTYAPPFAGFLNRVDLSWKKVVPFCTFGSGGLESSVKDLAAKQPKAEILEGYGVRAARIKAMPAEVDQFLKAGGFIEGAYIKLPEFSKPHKPTDAEVAIFDGAVKNYRMIDAKAIEVSTRSIPYGIEYLFTAVDMHTVSNLNLSRSEITASSGVTMKIYVTVANGELPVFTKVVR